VFRSRCPVSSRSIFGPSMGSNSKTDALSQRVDHGTGSRDNDNMTLLSPDLSVIQALEGLTAVEEEQDIPWEIWRALRDREKEEAVEELQKGNSRTI
jgi:hypothetical protein